MKKILIIEDARNIRMALVDDLKFEGYQVWAFKTNIAEDIVSGEENSTLIAQYDLHNFIQNVYKENSSTGGIELLYEMSSAENQLHYMLTPKQEELG